MRSIIVAALLIEGAVLMLGALLLDQPDYDARVRAAALAVASFALAIVVEVFPSMWRK